MREKASSSRKKGKIFLFETSVEEQNKTQGLTDEVGDIHYSLGLLYLDAVLKKNNYHVLTKEYLLWAEEHCLKAIEEQIKKFKPDFVGIAIMSMTRVSAYKAIKLIKNINKNIKIIVGGIHASLMAEQLIKNFPIDAICIGDAEESLVELLDAFIKNKSLNKVKGLTYKKAGKIIITKERPLNFNLDKLPYPSYDVFINPKVKRIHMVTSRGCPNNCSFCCIQETCKRVWRPRDPKKVVDEIEYLTKKYLWIKEIEFIDDTMTLNNQRIIELCKEIVKRNIKLKFSCEARIKPVSREMFYWMEKAGFNEICFGIETGSEKMLKTIHKNITKQECIDTFKIISEFKKISVVKYLMVGFPGESEETINETIEFVKQLQKIIKMDYFYVTPLWIYPGTEVYKIGVEKGWINDKYWLSDKPCPLFTQEHSEKWIKTMSNKITIETMLDRGKIYFLKRLIEKVKDSPGYYFRRVFAATRTKGI